MTQRNVVPQDWRISRRGLMKGSAAAAALTMASPATQWVALAQDGTSIVIGTLGEADSMNPFHGADNSETEWRLMMLFDEFVRLDPETYAPIPGIAASWEIEDMSFTFHLQPSIAFSDGTEVTADDVKFTIEGILNPQTASTVATKFAQIAGAEEYMAGTADAVSGIEVIDPKTLKITLAVPSAPFLYNMHYVKVAPKALLEGKDLSKASIEDFFQNSPVGAGPYIFESWDVGADFVATANPNFWEAGKPQIQRFVHRVIADSSALVNALQAGDIDGSLYPAPTLAGDLETNEGLTLLVPPFTQPNGTFFNTREAPLNDARVRRALAMAVNVDEYVASSLLGLGEAGKGPIAPGSWAFDPELEQIPFDPEGAKALLEEAGATDLELTMLCNAGNVLREDWLIRCQADWQEIGVKLNVEFIEWASLVERITVTRDFQIIGADFAGVTAEPSELFEQFHSSSSQNHSGFSTPELDELLTTAKQTLNPDDAKPIFAEIQAVLMQEVPMHWAWYRPFLYVISTDFSGYTNSNLDGGIFRSLAEMTGPAA
ncbi:MAG: ABC transporter substrate-binding protein [Thermomicrobiales bacterium]|nr:ABC transporter substrate-binding protein [Thermomicrobiales bacterium]